MTPLSRLSRPQRLDSRQTSVSCDNSSINDTDKEIPPSAHPDIFTVHFKKRSDLFDIFSIILTPNDTKKQIELGNIYVCSHTTEIICYQINVWLSGY